MRFLCVPCDEAMTLQTVADDDASLAFCCPRCSYEIVMQTNTAETQLVRSLDVHIGPRNGPPPTPLAGLRTHLSGVGADTLTQTEDPEPQWTEAAEARLAEHPRFVQPVVRKVNNDYARRAGLEAVTPEVMDACRRAHRQP